jgi:hypothetical protein
MQTEVKPEVLTVLKAYSIWYNRPSGEKMVMCRSYLRFHESCELFYSTILPNINSHPPSAITGFTSAGYRRQELKRQIGNRKKKQR